jgi:sulfotransferase family protein
MTMSSKLRETAANTLQWAPARTAAKRGVYAAARARGSRLARAGKLPDPANIFTAMSPKSGSQWAKALFDHEVVRAHSRLITLPQLAFEFGADTRPFPAATVATGIYASYEDYAAIPKPYSYRTIYIFRDPREIVVSGYYSATKSHPNMNYGKITHNEAARTAMRMMSRDLAIHFSIETLTGRLQEMASWVGIEDENVATFRLEDIEADPHSEVGRALAHCGVDLTEQELERVVSETSRSAMQQKDLARRPAGSESHYRVQRDDHSDVLKPDHIEAIEEIVPGLIEKLGYAPSPVS